MKPDVYIDGVGYRLDSTFRERAYVPSPQPQFRAGREDFWSNWYQRSFHQGERLEKILTQEQFSGSWYNDGEGVDVARWGRVKLHPALSRSLEVSSATLPMTVNSDGTKVIVGITASPYVKVCTRSASVWTWSNGSTGAVTGAVTDLITAGSTLYAVQNGKIMTSTDDGANFSEVGALSDVVGLAHVNNELYYLKASELYNYTTSTQMSAWGGTCITSHQGNIYFARDRRIWKCNGTTVTEYATLPPGFSATAIYSHASLLFILGYFKVDDGYRGAVYYINQGMLSHLYSLGDYSEDHRIYAVAAGDDELYFASPDRGGVDRFDLTHSGLSSGPAWAAHGDIPFKGLAVCDGALFVSRYDNDSTTDGVYIAETGNPSSYRTSGWIETATYDFDFPTDLKVFKSIGVYHQKLQAGQGFGVSYSLDEGDSWTVAGTSMKPATTGRTFELADVKGYSLKIKVDITGVASATPTLNAVLAKAAPLSEAKWQWEMRLLLDKLVAARGTGKAPGGLEKLREAHDKGEQIAFTDLYGDTHAVVVEELVLPHRTLRARKAKVAIRLREV